MAAEENKRLSTEPYKGVRDFYPEDWARIRAVFANARHVLTGWGYEEYQASPMERAELYEAKTSEEIVNNETYTFTDRGDRRVTLRPEMTPTLARMVAAKRRELPFPVRWFSIGNRFRYERPQRGRLREFYQIDVDLLGAPEGEADLEIIQICSHVLRSFGATERDFTIRMNSRSLLNVACRAAGLEGDTVQHYLRLLDKKAKLPAEEFAQAVAEITSGDPLGVIEAPSAAPDVAKEKERLTRRIEALKERGVSNVVFDPTITRGFDYYTGMVFEVFDTDPANPRAMFGGGRYDRLMELFNDDSLPAVGFAIGEVTLGDFLETHTLMPPYRPATDLYIAIPSVELAGAAQTLASELRLAGVNVAIDFGEKKLANQIKTAAKHQIPHLIVLGEDELASGRVRLRDLATGEERELARAEVAEALGKSPA